MDSPPLEEHNDNLQDTRDVHHNDTKQVSKIIGQYVYYGPPSPISTMTLGVVPLYGCAVGDYISMGGDLSLGKKNEQYSKIHDFFL
eukprot:c5390_g1_i1 orf=33-290(+)